MSSCCNMADLVGMADLIGVMQSANFDCEIIAGLLMDEEINDHLDLSPVLLATTLGLTSTVKSLLAEGVDASLRHGDNNEMSALGVAALIGNLEIVSALLVHGVDVDDTGRDGETALHTALIHGRANLDLIDLLLSAGADTNAVTSDGSTTLHCAAYGLNPGGVMAILLLHGAAMDTISGVRHSPLHVAARRGNLNATRALLAAGADANNRDIVNDMSALDFAASHGNVDVIRELARHGVDLNATPYGTGNSALHYAARMNQPGAVDALVEAGASVAVQAGHRTPLDYAAHYLALEAMHALLRHGSLVLGLPVRASMEDWFSCRDESPLHLVARRGGRKGAPEAMDLLLRWGADESELNSGGNTPAEVVGDDAPRTRSSATNADRVRQLLATTPADRSWHRRGLLLLCLARSRIETRKRRRNGGGSWGKAKEKNGKCKETRANDGGDSSGGGGGGGKRSSSSSSSSNGCSGGDGVGEAGNKGDFGGVVAMLLDIEEEGFFRTIVGYL